jgi:hypothetical protein
MASTSATLLAFGTASPPQKKTDGPGPSDWRMPRVEAPCEVLRLRRRPLSDPGTFVPCGNRTVFGKQEL